MQAKKLGATSGSKLVYPRGDVSMLESSDTRYMMYAELRNHSAPADIIRAVESYRQHASVSWLTAPGDPPKTTDDVVFPVVVQPYEDVETAEPQISTGEAKLTDDWPKTAGETLADFLCAEIDATISSSDAPVRRGKHLAKSTVSWVAYDLLEGCRRFPPGPCLKRLLRKLLDVDRPRKNHSKQYPGRLGAAWILAQAPHMSSEEIARELKVDRSSVSRWRRDPSFEESVSHVRSFILLLKKVGEWSTYEQLMDPDGAQPISARGVPWKFIPGPGLVGPRS